MLACRILQAVVLFFAFLAQVNQAQLFEEVAPYDLQAVKRSDFFFDGPQFKGLRGMRGKRMPYMNLKGLRGKRTF